MNKEFDIHSRASLIRKISQFTKSKNNNIFSSFDSLSLIILKNETKRSKALELASKLSFIEPESSLEWVDKKIEQIINKIETNEFFETDFSSEFLLTFTISLGTLKENPIRIIGDFILSTIEPINDKQFLILLRICSLFINNNIENNKNIYPTGSITFLIKSLTNKFKNLFNPLNEYKEICLKYLKEFSNFQNLNEILPEINFTYLNNNEYLNDLINLIQKNRISKYLNKRIFPSIIQILEPQLNYLPKEKTEEDKLRKRLKKEKSKAKRELLLEAEARRLQKVEEIKQKREKRVKGYKEAISQLEQQRTYTLDIAAAPAKNEEEEEEEENNNNIEEI